MSASIPFTKMHGAGNDFVVLDAITDPRLDALPDMEALAAAACDRRRGIGGDGLIVIGRPRPGAAVDMRMFNADGSESAMCGNGLRCVARYAVEHGLAAPGPGGELAIRAGAGVVTALVNPDDPGVVTVDMGEPVLDLAGIPVDRSRLDGGGGGGPAWRLSAPGVECEAVFVSMGNPHAVIYVDDAGAFDLAAAGPRLERHGAFPDRMNVHVVEVSGPGEVVMRTWERGSGLTGACGSGACAVCVAGVLTGRTTRRLSARLPGGELLLEWTETGNRVLMTGPAVEVFRGFWP